MNSNKNLITIIAVIILIVVFVLIASRRNRDALIGSESVTSIGLIEETTSSDAAGLDVKVEPQSGALKEVKVDVVATPVKSGKTVVFDSKTFSPSILRVKVGDAVIFSNASNQDFWPASDLHPTHKDYPGSDIKKCGTAEALKTFDACKKLKPGESWSFKFDSVGAWTYHNHLGAGVTGTVIVE